MCKDIIHFPTFNKKMDNALAIVDLAVDGRFPWFALPTKIPMPSYKPYVLIVCNNCKSGPLSSIFPDSHHRDAKQLLSDIFTV